MFDSRHQCRKETDELGWCRCAMQRGERRGEVPAFFERVHRHVPIEAKRNQLWSPVSL